MAFRDDLIKARSYIVFITGLLVAFSLVYTVEKNAKLGKPAPSDCDDKIAKKLADRTQTVYQFKAVDDHTLENSANRPVMPAARKLTAEEMRLARVAWAYFKNNTRPETGMSNSVQNYTASTMWDTASYMLGAISAERLGIISRPELLQRMRKILKTLETMPLFEGKLPNKSYSTVNGKMVTYTNKETADGIGWSAIDIGRTLVPMNALAWQYPELTEQTRRVIARWDFKAIANNGEMIGAVRGKDNKTRYVQEGRVGYEQYAAKSLALLGLDMSRALNWNAQLQYVDVYGLKIPTDKRDAKRFGAQNFVVSENYMLDGLEFGFDSTSREYAWRIYQAQAARYKDKGILTAVSEDHLDGAPYFVYSTIYSDGKPWNVITENGKDATAFRMLSTKAVFSWYALYRDAYGAKMLKAITPLGDAKKGWYTGKYESTGKVNGSLNANTNGIVLESLSYIQTGKMLPF
jgi:hypothetical protein